MNLSRTLSRAILRLLRWKVEITVPDYSKCIICVAPHTSNWDFLLGKLAYASVGRKAGFLMKQAWFFFPLGLIFKAIGGIPVPPASRGQGKGTSMVSRLVEKFRSSRRLTLAITPEGTRARTDRWRTGFLQIARQAHVHLVLGAIDYGRKEILITQTFRPTADTTADINAIKAYYAQFTPRHPEKFSTNPTTTTTPHEDSRPSA